MDVVGHHDEGGEFVSLAVEMSQCVSNDLGQSRIPEDAGPVPLIQPVVDASGETIAVTSRSPRIPRSRMDFQPEFAFQPPLIQFGLGKRISQPPGREDEFGTLLPVRQAVVVNINGTIRVEIEAGAVSRPPILGSA